MTKKRRRKLDKSSALNYAYSLLSYRDRSEGEISERLKKKGYPLDVISYVVSELRSLNYLDDKKFAHSWLKWRKESRPKSRGMIRWELLAKGVKREVVSEALDSAYPPGEEIEIAWRLAEKRAALSGSSRKRIYGYLRRRGFSYNVISEAIDHVEKGKS